MVKATLLSKSEDEATFHVQGTLSDGTAVDAILWFDGRDGEFDDASANTAGIEPGDERWDELIAVC